MSTPQTIIQLGGYSFVTNPTSIKYNKPISSSYDPSWSGGYITVFGQFVSDYTVEMTFPVLNYAQYIQLEALKSGLAAVSYISPEGLHATVFIMEVSQTSLIPGSLDAQSTVKVVLQFISIP